MLSCLAVIVAITAVDGVRPLHRASVDLIELNHKHAANGVLVFRQIIFWEQRYLRQKPRAWRGEWQPWQDVVVAWQSVAKWPQPYRRAGRWRVLWVSDSGVWLVTARSVVQTWTQYDPEVLNRQIVPVAKRRGL